MALSLDPPRHTLENAHMSKVIVIGSGFYEIDGF
jgi:hypothetical protein